MNEGVVDFEESGSLRLQSHGRSETHFRDLIIVKSLRVIGAGRFCGRFGRKERESFLSEL